MGVEFENPTLYRSIIGGLQYLVLTRPDIAYSVHKLSQYLSAITLQHWLACKKVLRYLQATITYGLYIQQDGTLETIGLTENPLVPTASSLVIIWFPGLRKSKRL